ncbi:myomegalin-like isoform X8 [Hemibagrus wyckioides]|uniref:myomegalin-like isoform X8 n=1 Tax=Hemibagrus wyckioides TaxID=337641 RepID=UPI00266D165F|nr:myomegalin-like isoform X8 [Hemibagrus wyckioides]
MKEVCRVCARELCGNQRRWIFHPAGRLQVLLSHALGRELRRDGRGEFVCSKCAFMLERMYRFDTVVARVEALSIERLHKLLLEKDRLRQCVRGMYLKHNSDATSVEKECMVDMSSIHDAKYCALVEEDLMYSVYESWAEEEEQTLECSHNPQCHGSDASSLWHRSRRCRGCSALRVADSDYEAVCKVPRKLARSISCGPSTRYSETTMTTTASTTLVPEQTARDSSDSDKTLGGRPSSSNSSESLTSTLGAAPRVGQLEQDVREEQNWDLEQDPSLDRASASGKLQLALCLLQNCIYKPVRIPHGSRLPVLIKPGCVDTGINLGNPGQVLRTPTERVAFAREMPGPPRIRLGLALELAELEEMWDDVYEEYLPFCLKKIEKKSLIEEQQSQLNQYESAAGQCVSELQKAQLQVQSLQSKIQESETSNKKLQEKLGDMETELRSIRQAAQSQERTIQSLTESLNTKETESQELYQVIEGQNATLCKLREMAHRSQLQHSQVVEGGDLQGEVVALQSSLFCCQLELEANQRAQRQNQRMAEDLAHSRDRLHSDLEAALQHRETTEKYNQDLRSTVQQLRSELQVKDAQLKEYEADKHSEVSARDKTISELQFALREKERTVQEYSELLDQPTESGRPRDALLDKLKSRIRDRDKALERSIDEKFRCLEEKETEVRKLQLALREKERDLERLRCILTNNEETITSIDGLMRSKDLELEQTQESFRKMQWLKQQSDEKNTITLRERDNIIAQLHTTLHARSKETEDLTAALLAKLSPSPNEVVEELKSRLALKERLFQEVLSERSRQTQEHHTLIQDLLNTISSRDQYIKESGERLRQVITERTGQLNEMRRQLVSREQELSDVTRERERERERGAPLAMEMERLQSILREKESLIQDLMQSQEEATSRPSATTLRSGDSNSELEMQAVKEELQIALRKHRETERELLELRSALTKKPETRITTDPQSALEQLVSEYQQLNQALRAEKKLYQNLNHMQSTEDSMGKTQALHMELDTVQALRGQLEEVLSRTRDTALALDRAAKAHADYGEFSTDEDEDEIEDDDDDDDDEEEEGSSSEEFTDSIEEDVKLTAESLASTENAGVSEGPVSRRISQEAMRGGWQDEVKQKKGEERETGEERSQLSQAGCTSLSQDRCTRSNLQEEKRNLELSGSRSGQDSGSGCGPGTERNVSVKCRRWEQSETDRLNPHDQQQTHMLIEEEEDEYEDEEEKDMRASRGKRGLPTVTLREGAGKRRCNRPHSLDLGVLLTRKTTGEESSTQEIGGENGGSAGFWQHVEAGLREQAERLRSDLALSRQESRELRERLMVSEATVHAQADQLKEYRELLTESAVQQDSKQVQVDLQDLGYETSGRSENEAEREDASSPEFDDIELCNSLSRPSYGSVGNSWHQHGDGSQPDDLLVQDLRAQLTRCHKVIRGLQIRVRSLSTTSDYASSLERTSRKVNWAFQESPAHSGLEDDEGWHSDGPAIGPLKSNRDLQELMSRVASLENQIRNSKLEEKRGAEEGKSATWPGKYNTLIQAQARELSHLRQRMREGRGICHILTQHLGDTTKAFEELLRANDIDYYMGQSFREQLSQSSSLIQRISIKLSGRDRSEVQDDKMGHELLALRLSKELQQKDKIIESLHTKLQQRPDTPSSSHAPSETTDQSDRTSFVSDERASINEDLELCSDVDAVSEYAQEEPAPRSNDAGFSLPHSLSSYPLMGSALPDPSHYTQLSHHSLHQPQKSDSSLVGSSAPWDMDSIIQPIIGLTGAPGYQSGNSHSGVDLIEEHLREIRTLRQRLEDSIRTNERLRQQLETRLAKAARDGAAPTNIYIQGLDTVTQLSNEIRVLKEENLSLQSRLQASRDNIEEVEQLREAVLSGRARLKQAELEAEQWKEELRRHQTHSCEQSQQIQQLRQERQSNQEHNNRLQHEVSLLQQQLSESRQLLHSLQCELQLYDRVCTGSKSAPTGYLSGLPYSSAPAVGELNQLLMEVRALRAQLERSVQENSALRIQLQKQLEQQLNSASLEQRPSSLMPASPLRDALYRRQLLHDPSPSPPVRDVGPFPSGPPCSPYSELEESSLTANDSLEPHVELEGDAPDGSFANRNGRHAIGHVDDFSALQQQVLEGRGLVHRMEATLNTCLNTALMEVNTGKALDYASVKTLLSNTKTLRQILEEAMSLLKMFWRAALPSSDSPAQYLQKEQSMKEEIQSLRMRIAEQEEVLQNTIQRLRSTSRTKESMETFIVSQLSRTRDVLKKARANLEKNELRISSLSSSSSSLYHGQVLKGAYPGSSDRGCVTPVIAMETSSPRLAKKRARECLH